MTFLDVLTDSGIAHVNPAHIVSLCVEVRAEERYDAHDHVTKVYWYTVCVTTTMGHVRQRYSSKEAAEAGLDEMLMQLNAMPATTGVW